MVSRWEETQPLQKREDNTGRAETSRDLRASEIGLAINGLYPSSIGWDISQTPSTIRAPLKRC